MFSWLRRKVRDAVLGGVNDALATIQAGPADDGPLRLEHHDTTDTGQDDAPELASAITAGGRRPTAKR